MFKIKETTSFDKCYILILKDITYFQLSLCFCCAWVAVQSKLWLRPIDAPAMLSGTFNSFTLGHFSTSTFFIKKLLNFNFIFSQFIFIFSKCNTWFKVYIVFSVHNWIVFLMETIMWLSDNKNYISSDKEIVIDKEENEQKLKIEKKMKKEAWNQTDFKWK